MNVFHKMTRKALAQNRTRTIVTIIGIILSMSMFTAVIEGAYSGVQFLICSEIEQAGTYHGCYTDVTEEEAEKLAQQEDIKDSATWQLVGWSHMETDVEGFTPYVSVVSVSDNFPDLVATKLVDGRLPENETEIALPSDLYGIIYKGHLIGDTVTLALGKRMANGQELGFYDRENSDIPEEITDIHDRTYTVVGVYKPLSYELIRNGGYVGLTKGAAEGNCNLFFTLKHIRTFYKDFVKSQKDFTIIPHSDLLTFSGVSGNDYIMQMLYGLVAVLVCLISFGSISLIYNSFSISVSERTKQFGILRSIGATKKQIRQSVFYEAFFLAGIGIPVGLLVGCVGIGVTLRCLQDSFAKLLAADATVKMELVLNPLALLVAAVVCLITVLLSAWIPAKRATKVNAIEAIRQVEDLKIKGKEVKTSKLTQTLFGFEGMMAAKSFKRNRKRYRSTILSLFLSIVLFISATSFCSYLTRTVTGFSSYQAQTDLQYHTVGEEGQKEKPDEVMELLSSVDGVTDALYMDYDEVALLTDFDNLDESYTHKPYTDEVMEQQTYGDVFCYLVFVDDENFRSLCKENHLKADNYFDTEHPTGILYNESVTFYQEKEDEPAKWYSYKNLDEKKLPCALYHQSPRTFEGLTFIHYDYEADGTTGVVYYPTDHEEEYWNALNEDREPDMSLAVKKTEEEGMITTTFIVNAVIKESLFSLPSNTPAVIYPYSMEQAVLKGDEEFYRNVSYETNFHFLCDDHRQVYNNMENLLKDHNMDTTRLEDAANARDAQRTLITVLKVFAYGFIVLISMIAIANVFNTITTNIMLRRREFAMLKSIGLGEGGFRRMMNYECMIYGWKGIMYGLPVAIAISYVIYKVTGVAYETAFYIPWTSIAIAVGSVFVVVFSTMLYATSKIKKDNPIDALKNENI